MNGVWRGPTLKAVGAATGPSNLTRRDRSAERGSRSRFLAGPQEEPVMPRNIIYIIGLVVIVLFVLGYFGLR